jgi:hypothetical protein
MIRLFVLSLLIPVLVNAQMFGGLGSQNQQTIGGSKSIGRTTHDRTSKVIGGPASASASAVACMVFSNSSTMASIPTGEDVTAINAVGGSGELNYSNPTTIRSTSSTLRVNVTSYGLPIDYGGERAALIDFDVASELSGANVIKATIHIMQTNWGTSDLGDFDMTLQAIGITDRFFDDWVNYSTSGASDVCFDYYDASTSSAWTNDLENYLYSGLAQSYPSAGNFWGVVSDTILTELTSDAEYTIDVTEQVQAWAAGENEGGFLLFGSRFGSTYIPFGNINYSDTDIRPYLDVYTLE